MSKYKDRMIDCENCGFGNPPEEDRCLSCGAELKRDEED